MKGNTRAKINSTKSVRKTAISAVDLFCGVGGLTHGLERAGIDVKLGVDIDPACSYPYEANNSAPFLQKSVEQLTARDVAKAVEGAPYTLLAGCAPCQPFSCYQQRLGPSDERWNLLSQFGRLVEQVNPDLVTMENVPNLAKQDVFRRFVSRLERLGFHVTFEVVNCADFGVPQHRNRLVLLASQLGPVALKPERGKPKTV